MRAYTFTLVFDIGITLRAWAMKKRNVNGFMASVIAGVVLGLLPAIAAAQTVDDPVLGALQPFTRSASQLNMARAVSLLCRAGNRLSQRLQSDCNSLVGAAFAGNGNVRSAILRVTPDDASIQAGASLNRGRFQAPNGQSGGFSNGGASSYTGFTRVALMGIDAEDEDLDARWSVYAQAQNNRVSHRDGGEQAAYVDRTRSLTLGIDGSVHPRFTVGAALRLGTSDLNLLNSRGGNSSDQRGFSVYANYSSEGAFYLDSIISSNRRSVDQVRLIGYSLGSVTVAQRFSSSFDVRTVNAALRAGWNLNRGAWQINPYLGIDRDQNSVDAYQEDAGANGDGNGAGWAVAVDAQKSSASSARLGTRFAYAMSTGNGVLLPFVDLRLVRVFSAKENAVQTRFLGDLSEQRGLALARWRQFTDPQDRQFAELNVGLSAQFAEGWSGFVRYQTSLAQSGFSEYEYALGARFEF
jgi:outer membrane autotransporter protein